MVAQEASGFCKGCNRQVVVRRQGTNHVLHLLLALVTVGIWIPIWLLLSIKIGGWRCGSCGLRASRSLFHWSIVRDLLFDIFSIPREQRLRQVWWKNLRRNSVAVVIGFAAAVLFIVLATYVLVSIRFADGLFWILAKLICAALLALCPTAALLVLLDRVTIDTRATFLPPTGDVRPPGQSKRRCQRCRKQLRRSATFCPRCGTLNVP
jgi:zinc-ribbon domain